MSLVSHLRMQQVHRANTKLRDMVITDEDRHLSVSDKDLEYFSLCLLCQISRQTLGATLVFKPCHIYLRRYR